VTKPWTGRLRPDFLQRCQPTGLLGGVTATPQLHPSLGSASFFEEVTGTVVYTLLLACCKTDRVLLAASWLLHNI